MTDTAITDTAASFPARLNRRQLAKIQTADRVLKAARSCFALVGYERATIRSIAVEAGMSTGAIFANYADKAALYRAVYGHDPIGPDVGRQAMRALQALRIALSLEGKPDTARAEDFADSVLELAGMPPVAVPTGDPQTAVQRFLEGAE